MTDAQELLTDFMFWVGLIFNDFHTCALSCALSIYMPYALPHPSAGVGGYTYNMYTVYHDIKLYRL